MKVHRCSVVLTALVAAGAFSLLLAAITRDRSAMSFLYSRPKGGEREGEFELFIGS